MPVKVTFGAISFTVAPPVKAIVTVTIPAALVAIEAENTALVPLLLIVPAIVKFATKNSFPVPLVINATLFVAAENVA